jgi:hypothetical protein
MDDLSGKINELLSDPESMQRIKSLAGMLTGSGMGSSQGNFTNSQQNSPPPTENQNNMGNMGNQNFNPFNAMNSQPPPPPSSGGPGDFNIDPQMIMKITQAMRVMNQADPRIDLLMALKENLGDSRQKKVDDAIKILKLLSLMPLLKEQGIFNL